MPWLDKSMDQSFVQKIQEAVAKNGKIGIVVGKNPTLDEMGAALGLYLTLEQNGKNVTVASSSEPVVGISSLVGIDKVRTELLGDGGDLIASFPYTEGEIEKVSYTLENGFLNIIVKAAPQGLSFTEKDVRYKRSGGLPSVLFVIGVQHLSDLGTLFDPQSLRGATIVNIDIKSENQGFGDIVWVSPKFSSVSEQVAYLLRELGMSVDPDAAQNLLSGIDFATNSFQDPKTSPSAFEMTGVLLNAGASRARIMGTKSVKDSGYFSQFQAPSVAQKPSQQQSPFQQPQRKDQPQDTKAQEIRMQLQQQRQQFSQKQPQQPQPIKPQAPARQSAGHEEKQDKNDLEAPPDWLAPKVYKGSTLA